jgi:hypothetical protein
MALSSMLNNVLSGLNTSRSAASASSLLLAGQRRTIMGLFADVTIEEKHSDELNITEPPTEVGTPISDHAYKPPLEVMIKVGWSESAGKLNDGLVRDRLLSETIGLVSVNEILQQLQANTVLLIVSTVRRLCGNMLIENLLCVSDFCIKNILMIDIGFK